MVEVRFGSLPRMVTGVLMMPTGDMGVMRRLLKFSGLMMLGRLAVMTSRVLVVISSPMVVFRRLLRHGRSSC